MTSSHRRRGMRGGREAERGLLTFPTVSEDMMVYFEAGELFVKEDKREVKS